MLRRSETSKVSISRRETIRDAIEFERDVFQDVPRSSDDIEATMMSARLPLFPERHDPAKTVWLVPREGDRELGLLHLQHVKQLEPNDVWTSSIDEG